MSERRSVVLVAFDEIQLLDLAGPVEVFDTATRILGDGRRDRAGYDVRIATPGGAAVTSSSRVTVAADVDLAAVASEGLRFDTLLVVGGAGTRDPGTLDVLIGPVRALADRADRIASVCTGSLVLAAAGLLDGYRATTHWRWCHRLAAHPLVEVLPDQIYVHDRDRWTSAGVTAGIDLALALVEADHGPELAREVATYLVVFAQRPGGQAQFSAQLRAQSARTPAVLEVQRWLPDHLADDLTVERLADRAGMSPRSFARSFKAETGTTPAAHVEELRVEAARRLLESTDLTVGAVARSVGLRHAETLHRAFGRRLGTTPASYRQHFARA
ncbi:GlxA family transcriptional regulator [Aquihabitans sp. G128]|nr:GlxA family transcriptional regulator [Aquihabitans sp. G128]QXC62327.1 GlxA family transcriptional regulator [Aquihabitans sp. G128]